MEVSILLCVAVSVSFTQTCLPLVFSSEQQRSKDAPAATSGPRASDSGAESRHPPPSAADNGPKPPSGKPGWAEEGGSGWVGQGAPSNHQVHMLNHNRNNRFLRSDGPCSGVLG